jgi:methyl-accepting chemotaxis protein
MGLFVVIGIVAAAAAVGGWLLADKKFTAAQERSAASEKMADMATAVKAKLWEVRDAEKDLLLAKTPESVAVHKAAVVSLAALLNGLYEHPGAGPARKSIATINEGLAQYSVKLGNLLEAGKAGKEAAADGSLSRLKATAKALQGQFAESRITDLIDVMAAVRRHEKDFLLRGAANDLALINKGLDELSGLVAGASLPDEQKADIADLLKTYRDIITATAAKDRLKWKESLLRLDEIHAYLAPSVESLAAFASDKAAAAAEAEQELRRTVRFGAPAFAVALLLVLTLSGFVLMRSIAVPVRTVASAALGLAEGDENVTIPLLGNIDDVGELARALASLKAALSGMELLRKDLATKTAEAVRGAAAVTELARMRIDLADAKEEAEMYQTAEADAARLRTEMENLQAEAAQLKNDLAKASAEIESGEAEVARLRSEVETLGTEAEKGEATVIEAALLRMDLESTKAELEHAEAAAKSGLVKNLEDLEPAGAPLAGAGSSPPAEETPPSAISSISKQVAISSESVSAAAYEAERTGTLIRGLFAAAEKIGEVEKLLATINEQTNLLVFKPGITDGRGGGEADNLVVLSSDQRSASEQGGLGEDAIGQRFDIIRSTTGQITWTVRDLGRTINSVKDIALEVAETSSAEAMKVTTELLEQSEHLREMLDTLVNRIQGASDDTDIAGGDGEKTNMKS